MYPEKNSVKITMKITVPIKSDTVDIIGYAIMSGSNPRLKAKAETFKVIGEANKKDKNVVATSVQNIPPITKREKPQK
jgi:hypothetical protein